MTLLVDETFSSGLPGGFATLTAVAGSPSQTHDAGSSAVDVVSGGNNATKWMITSAGALAELAAEFDIEITANADSTRVIGAYLQRVAGAAPFEWLVYHENVTTPLAWNIASAAAAITNTPTIHSALGVVPKDPSIGGSYIPHPTALNERVLLRIDWSAARRALKVSVNGAPIIQREGADVTGFLADSAYVGLYLRNETIRVHSVKVWDVATLAARNGKGVVVEPVLALTSAPRPDTIQGASMMRPLRDRGYFPEVDGGAISGSVVEDDSPTDIPVTAKVYVLDDETGALVAMTRSTPQDGNYLVRGLHRTRRYTVLSHDPSGVHNAVINDKLTPL